MTDAPTAAVPTGPVAATFVWTDGALVERPLEPHLALLAADSWLVTADGRVRALDAHRSRFLRACATMAAGAPWAADAEAFWDAAMAHLRAHLVAPAAAAGGAGAAGGERVPAPLFPRVEAARVGRRVELRLRIRVAPARRESAVLVTHGGIDPRIVPRVKGPDLDELIALRGDAQQELGADEVVLLDGAHVVDGSNSAVLWWRGETLMAPPGDLPRVESITARSIRMIAAATGTRVAEERARPLDLDGCEVWVVSALHGISVVEAWIDGPVVLARPTRAPNWRKRLDALRRPL